MATIATEVPREEHISEEKKTAEILFGGSVIEGLIAGITAVLAVIGLVGVYPHLLLAVSIIALGLAFLSEGAAITSRFQYLLTEIARDHRSIAELGIGTTSESMTGFFAIVLGILAVLGLFPMVLISAAIILIGANLIFSAGANERLNVLRIRKTEQPPVIEEVSREAVWAATGFQVIIGAGAATLGILALSGIEPLILGLVAILSISTAAAISGSALAGKMLSIFRL